MRWYSDPGSASVRKSPLFPGLLLAFVFGSSMIVMAQAAEDPPELMQAIAMGDPADSTLELMVIAPDDGISSAGFPVLGNTTGELLDYDFESGTIAFNVQGPISCFDLRENWQDSAVVLDVFDNNATEVDDQKLGEVIRLGLSADFQYIFDLDVLALDGDSDTACFYDAGTGMGYFGNSTAQGDLSVTVTPQAPANWPNVSIDDDVIYEIVVQNNGSSDIERLAVQELFTLRFSTGNFPVGLSHDEIICNPGPGADCADAIPQLFEIAGSDVQEPFIRGEELFLPAGASISFMVERKVRLSGGAVLLDAFGQSLPIHFVAVDLDNPSNHAATTETLQIVSTGQIEASADNPGPTVSADGTVSTSVAVQILNNDGQPMQEAGIEIQATVADPEQTGDINFPASILTDTDGTASFWIQSEKISEYEIQFTAPALLDENTDEPASDSVTLDFQADEVTGFEFFFNFNDPKLSPSTLPDFQVTAVDQFGNPSDFDEERINVNLIGPGGVDDSLGNEDAVGTTASFSGLTIPAGLFGEEFYLQARRTDLDLFGDSNEFELILAPESSLSVDLNEAPIHMQSVDQASVNQLEILVNDVDNLAPGTQLALLVHGQGPEDSAPRPIEEFCYELFVNNDCDALVLATGLQAGFSVDTILFFDDVTVRADANPGEWWLDFQRVLITDDTPGEEQYLPIDTLSAELTVDSVPDAATGFLTAARNGEFLDPSVQHVVREGELVEFSLSALGASVQDDRQLAVVFDGQSPSDSSNQDGMDVCLALLEVDSCAALIDLIDFDNPFSADIDLIEDLLIQVRQDAELGDWTFNFYLVSFDPQDADPQDNDIIIDILTLDIEVQDNPADGSLQVHSNGESAGSGILTLVQGQAFDLEIDLTNVDPNGLDGLAVLWQLDRLEFLEPVDSEEGCLWLLQSQSCDALAEVTGVDNPVFSSGEIFNQPVTLQPDADQGAWQLIFWLVAVENGNIILIEEQIQDIEVISDQLFSDSFLEALVE